MIGFHTSVLSSNTWRDEISSFKYSQNHSLPKGEKDDRFDGEKLPNWIEGTQQISRSIVEQDESIERQRNADVVDHGDVEVARIGTPVTVTVLAKCLEDKRGKRHDRLDGAKLQSRLLAESKKANGIGLAGETAGSVPPAGTNWFASYLGHDVAFAAEVFIA